MLNNSIFVHVSSGISNESSEAAILKEYLFGTMEEPAKLVRVVGEVSSLFGMHCDIIGGRDRSAVRVIRGVRGSKRAFPRAFKNQYPLTLHACLTCFAVSPYELHLRVL